MGTKLDGQPKGPTCLTTLPEVKRERILAEKDPERLEHWFERAVVPATIAEVLDEPSSIVPPNKGV